MSWRSKQYSTKSNTIPLGPRKFSDIVKTKVEPSYQPSAPPIDTVEDEAPRGRRQGRRSRWSETSANENKILSLLSMPTALTSLMTPEQTEAYALHLRIEEITEKIKINDLVPPRSQRDHSPAPVYDNYGRRTNTRESRYRKKLEHERHFLIEKAMKFIPEFKPPSDYRRFTKTEEKVYIPTNDYPEINFIGQLLGPRGSTLRDLSKATGAKIFIRGKGSVKEGKYATGDQLQNLEEDLHCLVIADSEEKVAAAVAAIEKVIETATTVPEAENELKQRQLRDVAIANGTFQDYESQPCRNCGEKGHRRYNCPQSKIFNANVTCRRCGQAGHFARDCNVNQTEGQITSVHAQFDKEYQDLMAEIGGGSLGYSQMAGQIAAGTTNPWQLNAAVPPSAFSNVTTGQSQPATQPRASIMGHPDRLSAPPGTSSFTSVYDPPPGLSSSIGISVPPSWMGSKFEVSNDSIPLPPSSITAQFFAANPRPPPLP